MEDLGYRTALIAPTVLDTPMSHKLVVMCRERSISIGKVSDLVDTVVRCAADESINGNVARDLLSQCHAITKLIDEIAGRALAIGSEESIDLEDDLDGLNSGKVLAKYHQAAETKSLMAFQKQRP